MDKQHHDQPLNTPDDKPQQEKNKHEDMPDELEQAKQKMEEYLDGWKRAKADYINLKKESEKKQQESIQFANVALILQLLPIYDNFKLAMKHIPAEKREDEWVVGIQQIKDQFTDLLNKLGIEEIKTAGEQFDPALHEAVAKEKTEGKKSNTIIEEIKPGYKLYDKVLEPAKVKVAE